MTSLNQLIEKLGKKTKNIPRTNLCGMDACYIAGCLNLLFKRLVKSKDDVGLFIFYDLKTKSIVNQSEFLLFVTATTLICFIHLDYMDGYVICVTIFIEISRTWCINLFTNWCILKIVKSYNAN